MERQRYLIASRRGPNIAQAQAATIARFGGDENDELKRTPVGRRVLELTAEQRTKILQEAPDLVIEKDEPLKMFPMPGIPEVIPAASEASWKKVVRVIDRGSRQPLAGVTVYALSEGVSFRVDTDAHGFATVGAAIPVVERLIVSPRAGHWSRVFFDVELNGQGELLAALTPLATPGRPTWGHYAMGIPRVHSAVRGEGIKVAIVDSGIAPHPSLTVKGGFCTLDDRKAEDWNEDIEGHGTHCAGIASGKVARPGVVGSAPDAEVYSVRVFPGGFVSDLVEAIEWCITNKMDVISLSLGSPSRSEVLGQVIADATARGITSVAATGNESSAVAYPAAFDQVVAVGAIGGMGTFPMDSGHALKIGAFSPATPGLFMASFSNFGPQVTVAAPGVAVISTVPQGYAAWDGTSMACPMVSGLVALLLQAAPGMRRGDASQVEMVRACLQGSCRSLGLPEEMQGAGLPWAPRAIELAMQAG